MKSASAITARKVPAAPSMKEKRGRYFASMNMRRTHAPSAISTRMRKVKFFPVMNGKNMEDGTIRQTNGVTKSAASMTKRKTSRNDMLSTIAVYVGSCNPDGRTKTSCAAPEKPFYFTDDLFLFLPRHFRKDRKGEDLTDNTFRHGEVAFFVPEETVRLLQVNRYRVVDTGCNALFCQELLEGIASFCADDEEMPNVRPAPPARIGKHRRKSAQSLEVTLRDRRAFFVPSGKFRKSPVQDRGLQFLQPAVYSLHLILIPLGLTILADPPHPLGELGVVGRHRAAVAEGAEILRRIKTERVYVSEGANLSPAPRGARRLRAIFEYEEFVLLCDAHDLAHIRGVAVEVNGQDDFRTLRDGALD